MLGKLGDLRAVEPLIMTLGDYDGDVRRKAAKALDELGEPKWKELVKGDVHEDSRRLGSCDDRRADRAIAPHIEALGLGYPSVAHRASETLVDFGDRAVEPLIKALGDGHRDVRCAAAEALGKLGDPRAVEPLIKLLRDDLGVRRTSARALRCIALAHPEHLRGRWGHVRSLARQGHHDHHQDNQISSDCWPKHDDHADSGIGLDFPDPPPGLDF